MTDRNGKTTTFNYDQDGNLASETLPNGVTQSMSYNGLDQLTNIGAKNSGNTQLTSFGFSYSKAQLSSVTDVGGNTTSYTYDANNALTGATQKNSGGTTLNSYGYAYDSVGNLTSKTVNGTSTSFTYNANNLPTQATGGMTASYSYNGQGDLTSRTVNGTTSTFSYNAGDQLTNLNGTSMSYTGTGETQRVGAGSNTYQYDALGMRKQTVSGTSTTFTTLPDGSVISETIGGSSYYLLTDGMGSVSALTDSSGAVVNQYTYDPMGNIVSSSGSVANPFTFQGIMYDSINGLYYTGSGYYDPATGQSIGCQDQGRVDPGEDNCGEDEGLSNQPATASVSFQPRRFRVTCGTFVIGGIVCGARKIASGTASLARALAGLGKRGFRVAIRGLAAALKKAAHYAGVCVNAAGFTIAWSIIISGAVTGTIGYLIFSEEGGPVLGSIAFVDGASLGAGVAIAEGPIEGIGGCAASVFSDLGLLRVP